MCIYLWGMMVVVIRDWTLLVALCNLKKIFLLCIVVVERQFILSERQPPPLYLVCQTGSKGSCFSLSDSPFSMESDMGLLVLPACFKTSDTAVKWQQRCIANGYIVKQGLWSVCSPLLLKKYQSGIQLKLLVGPLKSW